MEDYDEKLFVYEIWIRYNNELVIMTQPTNPPNIIVS